MSSTDQEDLIRERAHQIWEREGRPEGESESHWQQARLEIEAETEIGATDDLEDTELTSALETSEDLPGETPVASEPSENGEDAEAEDLGGRVKDPALR